MADPKNTQTQEQDEAPERKLDLERETLKDLTPQDEQAEGVKGGPTTPAYGGCSCGSA